MARMRQNKKRLKEMILADNWQDYLEEIAAGGIENIGPLMAFLLLDPQIMHRAAKAIGLTVAKIAQTDPETAKNIIRRFMWHMNEESGNIGWGIPCAFAESLVASPEMMRIYSNILLSYINDLGFDDNYCDHDILRRSCYWAIGCFAEKYPEKVEKARPYLLKGLEDRDEICRGMAAWALGKLPPSLMDVPMLNKLANSGIEDEIEIYEDNGFITETVSGMARKVLANNK